MGERDDRDDNTPVGCPGGDPNGLLAARPWEDSHDTRVGRSGGDPWFAY